jgi:hypothetical protein
MTRNILARVGAAALLCACAAGAEAKDPLVRKAALGIAMEPAEGGAKITTVTDGLTAAKAGLAAGDILTALNGRKTPDPGAVAAIAGTIRAGEPVAFDYTRGGKADRKETAAIARPFETYQGAAAVYGAVPFKGGHLRDVLVTPAKASKNGPVVYLIQGAMCANVEGVPSSHPYGMLVQELANRGLATYRIEKPGMGDSAGTPACADVDFATELDGFRAGLQALIKTRKIAPGRIVIFGHSMGGIQGPLLAAENGKLGGVATMGTVLRDWRDYLGEVFWMQGFFSSSEDPVENAEAGAAARRVLDRLFIERASLAKVAADNAEDAKMLKEFLGWDGGERFMNRNAGYWVGISGQKLVKAWRDANAPVLAMYGESDFAAMDDRDHRLIVDVVNFYRPGTAKYVLLEKTGHGFGLDGTRAEAAAKNKAAGGATGAPLGPMNPKVATELADWVDSLKIGAR